MSKFEELCHAFAVARRRAIATQADCNAFVETFVRAMGEYFGCPLEAHNDRFDDEGVLHFDAALTLLEDPNHPDQSAREKVVIPLSVHKIIDNYVLTACPWGKEYHLFENEFDRFTEVYEFLFEKIKQAYNGSVYCLPDEKQSTRNLWFNFHLVDDEVF